MKKFAFPQFKAAPDATNHVTVADGAKTAFVVFVGGFAPFAILVILTISAGYYFNALRGFSADIQSLVAYGTALIVELVNLALFFVSAKAFWSGKRSHFVTALIIGMMLTAISIIAQVLYLSNNLDMASIKAGAGVLAGVPLVGGIASTAFIIITRALALHVAEFACCYVVARAGVSHRKVMQARIEEQSEKMLLLLGDSFNAFMQQRMQEVIGASPTRPALPESAQPSKSVAPIHADESDTWHMPALQVEQEASRENGNGTFPKAN